MIELSVIIPVRNDAERLARCLKSLQATDARVEIIVADNGSSDRSADVGRQAGARVLSIPNQNVASVRNMAAQIAGGQLLAFVDADHVVAPSWLTDARQSFDRADVGAVGAAYLPPDDGTWVQQMYGALRGRTVGRGSTRWLGSGNLVVRRAAFDQIGGFDRTLEACEDVDLCQRLRAAGWGLIADERLRSTHYGDPPTLRALFRAERWRGRNNLQVSLRGGITLRDVPSLMAPVLLAAAGVAVAASPLLWMLLGAWVLRPIAAIVAMSLVLPVLQAVRMTARSGGIQYVGKALAVAVVYHVARATALVAPAGHHRR